MSQYLTYSEDFLTEKKGYWTAKEICQQPRIWREAAANVKNEREAILAWLKPILAKTNLRIILTGAGTSAYVGNAIVPHLTTKTGRVFEAISTTDLVSNPLQYLIKDIPTLVISYGRSGNSPESITAVKLVDQIVDNSYHLILTCNPEGQLSQSAKTQSDAYSMIMPEGTLDKSFAMTSSFTSMFVTTLAIFTPDDSQLELAAQWTETLLDTGLEKLKIQATKPTQRLVFLGSGGLQGIAKEAALKCLELTAGQLLSYFESPLGFRHGPKSLMDATTEVVVFSSTNEYTKLYDADLISELKHDNQALDITVLNAASFNQTQDIDDVWAGLPYVVYSQVLAFYKSIDANITPDNPCPTGEVNRVVQGVTLYPLALK